MSYGNRNLLQDDQAERKLKLVDVKKCSQKQETTNQKIHQKQTQR